MTNNRTTARTLSAATLVALQAVASEHGLIVSVGSARYSDARVSIKVEFAATVAADGEGTPGAPADFARDAAAVGLDDHAFGREFVYGGESYRVTGIKRSRRKYPVTAVRVSDGREYKFPATVVNAGFVEAAADDVDDLTGRQVARLVGDLMADTDGLATRAHVKREVMSWAPTRRMREYANRFAV